VTLGAAGSNISVVTLSGGYTITTFPVSANQLNLISGNLIGTDFSAVQLLSNNQGFNLDAPISVSGQASLGGLLSFGSAGGLTIGASGSMNLLAAMVFTGLPDMTVTNNGIINANSPLTFQNINLAGAGSVSVSSILSIQAAQVSQAAINLSGSGVFKGANTQITLPKIAGSPKVKAVIGLSSVGTYTFYCSEECDNISTSGTPTDPFRFTVSA